MRQVLRDIGQYRVRPRRRALIAVPVALGATGTLVALAACGSGSSAGNTDVPSLTPGPDAAVAACTDLMDRLPETVLSRARNTTQEPTGIATWGDPAISLSCGATPTGPTTDRCIDINDVAWVFSETSTAYTFITYGRDPAVQVQVPTSVERSAATAALVDLEKAVKPLGTTARQCSDLVDSAPSTSAS
ncbi:DUF3515 family protein [Kineosporia sp. NBRC 101731]|uniref:DUF3515 family protein n=1 Tax=Kineosporia sp. NBRC 101731 TaxID=3032199 RepID=UPI0024A39511|nr:DUF3515 family protein [Kineosporia sp. NBRC 101731]GLY30129.1 hypothetical protein Kisp02_34940 [Kineosporia sp. NBRC 101731]